MKECCIILSRRNSKIETLEEDSLQEVTLSDLRS